MSESYSVYTHPTRGAWGHTRPRASGTVHTVSLSPEGSLKFADVTALKFGAVVQEKVRAGFKASSQARYLATSVREGKACGEFVATHPDLNLEEFNEGTGLFFVALPRGLDVPEFVDRLHGQIDGSECTSRRERDAWLKHAFRVSNYLPVLGNDPCAALAVAQWAHEQAHSMVCLVDQRLPEGAPASKRYLWRSYLAQWAKQPVVDSAFAHLGMPLHEVFVAESAQGPSSTVAENWFDQSQQFSF